MFDYKKHFLYAPDEEVSDSPILPRPFNQFPEWNDLIVLPYDGMSESTMSSPVFNPPEMTDGN